MIKIEHEKVVTKRVSQAEIGIYCAQGWGWSSTRPQEVYRLFTEVTVHSVHFNTGNARIGVSYIDPVNGKITNKTMEIHASVDFLRKVANAIHRDAGLTK